MFSNTITLSNGVAVPQLALGTWLIDRQTAERMQENVGNGVMVLSGKRFAAGVAEDELKRWAERIGG